MLQDTQLEIFNSSLVTQKQIARELGVKQNTVSFWIYSSGIKQQGKRGRSNLYKNEDFDQFRVKAGDGYIDVTEAAKRIGCTTRILYTAAKKKKFKCKYIRKLGFGEVLYVFWPDVEKKIQIPSGWIELTEASKLLGLKKAGAYTRGKKGLFQMKRIHLLGKGMFTIIEEKSLKEHLKKIKAPKGYVKIIDFAEKHGYALQSLHGRAKRAGIEPLNILDSYYAPLKELSQLIFNSCKLCGESIPPAQHRGFCKSCTKKEWRKSYSMRKNYEIIEKNTKIYNESKKKRKKKTAFYFLTDGFGTCIYGNAKDIDRRMSDQHYRYTNHMHKVIIGYTHNATKLESIIGRTFRQFHWTINERAGYKRKEIKFGSIKTYNRILKILYKHLSDVKLCDNKTNEKWLSRKEIQNIW